MSLVLLLGLQQAGLYILKRDCSVDPLSIHAMSKIEEVVKMYGKNRDTVLDKKGQDHLQNLGQSLKKEAEG